MVVENVLLSDVRGTQYAKKIRRTMFAIGKKYDIPKEEILKTSGRINVALYELLNKRIEDYKRTIHIMSGLDTESIDNISVLRRINIDISGVIEIDEEKKTMTPKDFMIEVKYPIIVTITEKLEIPQNVESSDVESVEQTQEE